MNRAADEVRAMGSGVPPRLWKRLSYMVVQVVIDESGNAPDQEVIALGGVIAKAASWVKFAREWDRVLRAAPMIDAIKYTEITRMHGRFAPSRGWSTESRDQLLRVLVGLIAKHAIGFVGVIARHDDFNQYVRAVPQPFRNLMSDQPNVLMAGTALLPALHVLDEARIYDVVDVVFDRCPGTDALIQAMWTDYQKVGENWEFTQARGRQCVEIGDVLFLSPSRFVPLQAADLVAGLLRAQALGAAVHPAFLPLKNVPALVIRVGDEMMKRTGLAAEDTARRILDRFPHAPLYGFDQQTAPATRARFERKLARRRGLI